MFVLKKTEKNIGDEWQISFTPILRYSAIFCVLMILTIGIGGLILSFSQMKMDARAAVATTYAQISQRVDASIQLLEALASLPEFYDSAIEPIEKVKKLDQMSPYFGYMMICYVDSDITVYSDGSEPASLASRDYMQRLFSTGTRQVTDSFAAGADGVTLNYTVAVPLRDEQDNITGCLFCAIYFDEVVQILEHSAESLNGSEATLVGTQGQVMSSTAGLHYGESVLNEIQDAKLIGTTVDELEERLLAAEPGEYWSFKEGSLNYTVYQRVENTNWDILCTVNIGTVFSSIFPGLLFMIILTILLCMVLMIAVRRYIAGQMQVVNVLVQSVEELEKKVYQDERPDKRNFTELIRLTSNGLTDSLTGVVTRSVFFNQAQALLKKTDAQRLSALCFVDMDNLKYINDTFGHSGGDVALKSVGYILREYEKRYDGVVGRYGGDEFVILLLNLDDEAELCSVLDELVLRMHTEIGSAGEYIPVQCSVGVAIYQPEISLEQLIANADEALYFVKQNGKGYYNIYKK